MIDFPKLLIKENSLRKFLKTNQSFSNIYWLVSFSIPLIFILMFSFFGKHLRFLIFVIYVFPWIILNIYYLIIWFDGYECIDEKYAKLEFKTYVADIFHYFYFVLMFKFLQGSKWIGFLYIPFLIFQGFTYCKHVSFEIKIFKGYYNSSDKKAFYFLKIVCIMICLAWGYGNFFIIKVNAGLEFLIFFYCIICLDLYLRAQLLIYGNDLLNKPFKFFKVGFRLWWTSSRDPLFMVSDLVQNCLILLQSSVIILLVFFINNKSF